jgi:hypothetical protein
VDLDAAVVTHRVQGLLWAAEQAEGPYGRTRRAAGAKADGLRYESAACKAIGGEAALWWKFIDRHGSHWCQTDLLVRGKGTSLVLEIKLTWTWKAWVQLEELYRPVVEAALGKPMLGVQVCKNITSEARDSSLIVHNLHDAVVAAKQGKRVTLHWSGVAGTLQPPARPLARRPNTSGGLAASR